jgi:glycine/D-amino acid oxidase-like deaminating enzyme
MKSSARAVVVGGGIVGASVLYHLTRAGWSDVALVEKGELGSGSTWHAAGNTPHFNTSLNLSRIHLASTQLYARLEAETGQAVGFHRTGSLRLASSRADGRVRAATAARPGRSGCRSSWTRPRSSGCTRWSRPPASSAPRLTPDDGHVDRRA